MQNHKGPGYKTGGPLNQKVGHTAARETLAQTYPGTAAPSWAAATAFRSPAAVKVPTARGRGLAPTFSRGAWGRWPVQSTRDFINHQIRWQVRWLLAGFASVLYSTGACKTSSLQSRAGKKPLAPPPREGLPEPAPSSRRGLGAGGPRLFGGGRFLAKPRATPPPLCRGGMAQLRSFPSAPHRHHPLGIRVGERREGPLYWFCN